MASVENIRYVEKKYGTREATDTNFCQYTVAGRELFPDHVDFHKVSLSEEFYTLILARIKVKF